ncbi:MAG: hypothetical protein NW223_22775 [Hyphomicrobiaceae bacterium]|nr:hypothetical protein [Hyphomicrobiaceae bacterium]
MPIRFGAGLAATIAVLLAALGPLPARAQQPRIQWELTNPFRFFLDNADTDVHRATFASLNEREKRSPVLAAERLLSERHPDGWAATMFHKTCWDPTRNRYACAERSDYLNPKSHQIRAQMDGLLDAGTVDCAWLTAPQGKGPRGRAIVLPCDTPVEIDIPYPGGAWLTVEIGGRQVAEVSVKVTDLLIAGLGDSFASGEGNPDVPVRFSPERVADYDDKLKGYPARVGTWSEVGERGFIEENARWLDQACHRSLYSHQLRAALQLAVEDPHRAVTFVGLACSGAETVNGLFLRYKGHEWVPNPPLLSQISAVAEAQCGNKGAKDYDLPQAYHLGGRIPELEGGLVLRKCDAEQARRLDLLFVSIGGNDIGFARLVANAVLSDSSILRSLGGWFGQVYGYGEARAQLESLDDRLKATNRAIHNILHVPWNESDRVILTGYPPMALMDDGKTFCPDGKDGMTVLPDFQLSEVKAREGEKAGDQLNGIMRAAAQQHSWTFVEGHRAAFRGRGICASFTDAPWSQADELRLPRKLNGAWDPYNPADYKPYAPRQRWFRTPNDAFMTANFHVSQSILLKTKQLAWVQLLLAATYSGAFHPTAEGQAAIADGVLEKARAVLARYEARRRARDVDSLGRAPKRAER